MANEILEAEHWLYAEARAVLGACLSAVGRLNEAAPLLHEGYSILMDTKYDEHPDVVRIRAALLDHDRRMSALDSPQ